MIKFFWYLGVGTFYVLWVFFVMNSLFAGMGEFLCNHFPVLSSFGLYRVGMFSAIFCAVSFFGMSYLHTFVKDNYLNKDLNKEEESTDANEDDGESKT